MRRRPLAAALAAALATACGSDPTEKVSASAASGWIDVPGMACADGSPTGIWVSPGSSRVLIVLSGGGACWSGDRCPGSVPRRFGRAEFEAYFPFVQPGSLLDRALAGNPFATWTHVFVPYCTGDVHLGDRTNDYAVGATTVTWRQHGFGNLRKAIERTRLAVPAPAQVVVSGFSAGGFGALAALDLAHAAWDPGAPTSLDAALVDDSGQTFVGGAMPASLLGAWWDAWNLASTVAPLCPDCGTDLSAVWDRLHARYPADRLALLSTTQDATMRGFFGVSASTPMDGAAFESGLSGLCAKLAGLSGSRAACFRVGGARASDHALFTAPGNYQTAGAVTLLGWLGQLAAGDPAWAPAGP